MSPVVAQNATKETTPGQAKIEQLIRTLGTFKPKMSSDVQYYNFLREFCIINNCSLEQGIEQAGVAWQKLGRPQQDFYKSESHACLPIPVPLHLVYDALRDERIGRLSLSRIDTAGKGKNGRYVIASYNTELHRKCLQRRLAEQKLLARFRPQLLNNNNSNNNNNNKSSSSNNNNNNNNKSEIDNQLNAFPLSTLNGGVGVGFGVGSPGNVIGQTKPRQHRVSWLTDTSIKGRPPKMRRLSKPHTDVKPKKDLALDQRGPELLPAGSASVQRLRRPQGCRGVDLLPDAAAAATVTAAACFARRMCAGSITNKHNKNMDNNNNNNNKKEKNMCIKKKKMQKKKHLSNNTNGHQRATIALTDRAIGDGQEQQQQQQKKKITKMKKKKKKNKQPQQLTARKNLPQLPSNRKKLSTQSVYKKRRPTH